MTQVQDLENSKANPVGATNGKSDNGSPQGNEDQPASSPISQQKGQILRNRLLWTVLPTVLIPLVVAAGAGFAIIHQNIRARYEQRLERQSILAQEAIDQLTSSLFQTSKNLATNPLVIDAVRNGSDEVENNELTTLSQEELEQQFGENNSLNPDVFLNNYLQQIVSETQLTEVVVTETSGFNVASNEITADLIHTDNNWWEQGINNQQWLGDFDVATTVTNRANKLRQLPITQSIQDPESGDFLGLVKAGVPRSAFEVVDAYVQQTGILETGQVQVFDPSVNQVLVTVTPQGPVIRERLEGGEVINRAGELLINSQSNPEALLSESIEELKENYGIENADSNFYFNQDGQRIVVLKFSQTGRTYELVAIPETDWVSVASVDNRVLASAGQELIGVFAITGGLLAILAVGVVLFLANGLSNPLRNITQSAQKAAGGDLSARAQPQGSRETRILAASYNNLVERVQQLLKEQEETAEQQRREREELEAEVSQLMTDIEDASEGDLTVRAQLMEGDIGIVADLFNAVVENLQDTARQVKTAASQVNSSLGENEVEIRQLAEGAIAETEEIQSTLKSVAEMNDSIQGVAGNAQKAASIADTALTTAQEGNQAMDKTVQSIQNLRATVGETSKKMKQMGESAQKISQVVSLIDEISLKTSLLAINASVEANRAGELGQGFTAVAEQVEALAEQSASAAKEISQIVANIQSETQEAIETMEQGTSEVVESTRSVEETQARLANVVERSEEINTLMQSISRSTVSQAETSQNVARLMEQVANSSQSRSQTSQEVAQSIQETAQVSKSLEESVQGFKVDE